MLCSLCIYVVECRLSSLLGYCEQCHKEHGSAKVMISFFFFRFMSRYEVGKHTVVLYLKLLRTSDKFHHFGFPASVQGFIYFILKFSFKKKSPEIFNAILGNVKNQTLCFKNIDVENP